MRWWPRCSTAPASLIGLLIALSTAAMVDRAWIAGVALGAAALGLAVRAAVDYTAATGVILSALPAAGARAGRSGESP